MTTKDSKRKITAVGVAGSFYQQIAAVIGSFAVVAFLHNFIDFDWRGFLATLISAWDEYVRPAARWLLHYGLEVPLGEIGWSVEFPQWLRDYLSVGLVMLASLIRIGRLQDWKPHPSKDMPPTSVQRN